MKTLFIPIALVFSLSAGAAQMIPIDGPLAALAPTDAQTQARSSTEPELQAQISQALLLIMSTSVGKAICKNILNAEIPVIEYHLGVDNVTATKIAQGCGASISSPWISPSDPAQIEKLTVTGSGKRSYVFVINGDSIPFDSWTEPFSNTTVFVIHSKRDKPVNHQRLIQLLAHETAVYFDSKAMLGHGDAANLPELRQAQLTSVAPGLDPKVAVMNPIIAHTLTFVRALQVERAIVQELVDRKEMAWPDEYSDPLISELLSDKCGQECLSRLVEDMSEIYLPLSLPLVALSPTYRTMKQTEISYLRTTQIEQWKLLNAALDDYPRVYVQQLETLQQKPFMEVLQFFANPQMAGPYVSEENSFRGTLWPQDWLTVKNTNVIAPMPMTFLEFMKKPLLSGYNILLSNGPRVRIRAGDAL